jgi:uncharacterized integral membrane protein
LPQLLKCKILAVQWLQPTRSSGGLPMRPKMILLFVVIVLAVVLLLQNTGVTEFNLLFWDLQMSRAILVFIVLVIGFVLGFVVAKLTGRRRSYGDHSHTEGRD